LARVAIIRELSHVFIIDAPAYPASRHQYITGRKSFRAPGQLSRFYIYPLFRGHGRIFPELYAKG
jgi:hypothetical protein